VKTPSFFELKTMVEYLNEELDGAQLQEIFSTEEGLVLGFYRFTKNPKMSYLVFDLDRPFPFLGLLAQNPWAKLKKTKPVGLFLSAHAKNQHFEGAEIKEEFGRVVWLRLGKGEHQTEIEFRAIPKQANLIVKHLKKTISWDVVKDLGQNDLQYTDMPEEIRSITFLAAQWSRRRGSFQSEKNEKGATSPFEKWVKTRTKDLDKKKKALEAIQKQIEAFTNEEWSQVGEFLKTNSLKQLKPEWSVYIDFKKTATENMQR